MDKDDDVVLWCPCGSVSFHVARWVWERIGVRYGESVRSEQLAGLAVCSLCGSPPAPVPASADRPPAGG